MVNTLVQYSIVLWDTLSGRVDICFKKCREYWATPALEFPQRTKIRKAASAPAGRERRSLVPIFFPGGLNWIPRIHWLYALHQGERETPSNTDLRAFRRNLHQRIWVLRKSRNDHIWPSLSSDYSQWAETKASQDRIPPNPILIRADTEVIPQFLLCIFQQCGGADAIQNERRN